MLEKKSNKKAIIAACAIMATSGAVPVSYAADVSDDYLLVPGERAGFISADTTESQLRKSLSKKSIARTLNQEVSSGAADGPLRCVTELFPGTEKEIWLAWQSDKRSWHEKDLAACMKAPAFSHPSYVLISNPFSGKEIDSPWRTADGIGLNSNLVTLETINGKPITFSMDDDTLGDITSLNGGKLEGVIKDGMLSLAQPDVADAIRAGAKNKTDTYGGEVSSDSLSPEIKAQISLVLFAMPL